MHKSKYNSNLINYKKKKILKIINILIVIKNKKNLIIFLKIALKSNKKEMK